MYVEENYASDQEWTRVTAVEKVDDTTHVGITKDFGTDNCQQSVNFHAIKIKWAHVWAAGRVGPKSSHIFVADQNKSEENQIWKVQVYANFTYQMVHVSKRSAE